MKRHDIKNDKRFKERLERQLRIDRMYTVFKRSLKITWPEGERDAYVKAIGSNNSFFVVVPLIDDDGSRQYSASAFMAGWATTGSGINDAIKNIVLSALVLCAEDEIEKVKEFGLIPTAIQTVVEHKGTAYFEVLGPSIKADIQGKTVDKIANPYHRKQ